MQSREDWLKERKELLTASDVAAILGENPFKTNIDVYIDKTSDDICQSDMDHLKFGRDVEGAIAGLYESRTGRPVADLGATVIQRHSDIRWLGATLDRMTKVGGNDATLQLKHVSKFDNKDEWVEDPPAVYQIQCQIEAACKGTELFSLAGMFPGYQLGYVDMPFSQSFIKTIYPVIDEFWNHNVKKKIPPELIEHSKNLESVKALYNSESGETVMLSDEELSLVYGWEAAKHNARDASKTAKNIEAELRHKVGNATFASLPDGRFLTLKTTERKGYTVQPTSYRTLRVTKKLK